jgi:hypothetical protein
MNPHRSSPSSFEDPELKSAIRRAWGCERAPADLKERVKLALASESLRDAKPSRRTDRPVAGPPTSVGAAPEAPTALVASVTQ